MLTAREAAAVASLKTPQDFSLHKHLEVRIWDSISNGGTYIIYAGELSQNVRQALIALGYHLTSFQNESNVEITRIDWEART